MKACVRRDAIIVCSRKGESRLTGHTRISPSSRNTASVLSDAERGARAPRAWRARTAWVVGELRTRASRTVGNSRSTSEQPSSAVQPLRSREYPSPRDRSYRWTKQLLARHIAGEILCCPATRSLAFRAFRSVVHSTLHLATSPSKSRCVPRAAANAFVVGSASAPSSSSIIDSNSPLIDDKLG